MKSLSHDYIMVHGNCDEILLPCYVTLYKIVLVADTFWNLSLSPLLAVKNAALNPISRANKFQ